MRVRRTVSGSGSTCQDRCGARARWMRAADGVGDLLGAVVQRSREALDGEVVEAVQLDDRQKFACEGATRDDERARTPRPAVRSSMRSGVDRRARRARPGRDEPDTSSLAISEATAASRQ